MPRNTRINVINPTLLTEALDVYGETFERSMDGFITNEVIFVDA